MVIPISFAALLIPIRPHPAAILAPERNVLWVLAADAVHEHANAPLGLVASARRLEDALQWQQTFAPQLDLFSREPHVVTIRYRLFLELDAELIVFDQPFAGSLAPH